MNCRRFYDCTSGAPLELECFEGYGFNKKTQHCDLLGKPGVCDEMPATMAASAVTPATIGGILKEGRNLASQGR